MDGVSVPFFCGAIKILEKQHGRRMCATQIENFRAALAEAEAIYQTLPPDESKKSKPRKKS